MRTIRNFRVTPLAICLLLAVAACIVVVLIGSQTAQILAALLAIAILGVLVGGGRAAPSAVSAIYSRGKTITYAPADVLDEAPVDESAWTKERERREREDSPQKPSIGL